MTWGTGTPLAPSPGHCGLQPSDKYLPNGKGCMAWKFRRWDLNSGSGQTGETWSLNSAQSSVHKALHPVSARTVTILCSDLFLLPVHRSFLPPPCYLLRVTLGRSLEPLWFPGGYRSSRKRQDLLLLGCFHFWLCSAALFWELTKGIRLEDRQSLGRKMRG